MSEGKNLISIIFYSNDENVHYSIICKNNDLFTTIENKLYNAYPEYKNKENIFLIKGENIQKNKTLKDNNIKNSDIIIF